MNGGSSMVLFLSIHSFSEGFAFGSSSLSFVPPPKSPAEILLQIPPPPPPGPRGGLLDPPLLKGTLFPQFLDIPTPSVTS